MLPRFPNAAPKLEVIGDEEAEVEEDVEELDEGQELEEETGIGANQRDEDAPPTEEKKSEANTNSFDFRFGQVPLGVTCVGHGELIKEKDGSSHFVLGPNSYLKVDFEDLKCNGGKMINDYTLTMDIKIDMIPEEGMSILHTGYPDTHRTDEAYLYPTGSVGIFDEFGRDTFIKPGKWNRIVITMGGSWDSNRRMETYLNGKHCATIKKGIFEKPDGRFGINQNGVMIFASQKGEHMPGVAIRYLQIKTQTMTADNIIQNTHAQSVFSQWEIERHKSQNQMLNQLSLASLYKRPPPMWNDRAFYAHFGDAFIENTGLEGGSVYGSVRVLSLTLNRMLVEQKAWFNDFDEKDMAICDRVRKTLEDSVALCRKFVLACRSGPQLVAFIRKFRKILEAMKTGDFVFVPGGWKTKVQHNIMLVLERQEATFRLVICNTGWGNEYHPVTAENHPKIKFKNSIAIDEIAPERILDNVWWGMVFKNLVYPSELNGPERLYDYLLPFLTKEPLEASIFASNFDDCMDWRSPQLASTDYHRCVLEACHYMNLRVGLSAAKTKVISFNWRRQFVKMVVEDLHVVWTLTESDIRLIKMSCEQLAYSAVKMSKKGVLTPFQLSEVKKTIDGVEARIETLPCDDANSAAPPPQLDLNNGQGTPTQWFYHQNIDRLQRKDDTDGLAGPPIIFPKYVPIDLLQLPARADNFEDALAAIRYCDKMCTLISVQSHTVKNGAFLKCALIQHTFTQVVPVPLGRHSPNRPTCVWAQPLRYALQLDILLLLQRLIEHFASSALSLRATRSFDAVRIVVPGCMTAIADAVIRKRATDIPSEVSLHIAGFEGTEPYGVGPGCFGEQSETIEVVQPELNIARTAVLDYFTDLEIGQNHEIFCWERGQAPEPSSMQLVTNICQTCAFDPSAPHNYIDGEQYLIIKNYPEFAYYRDIAFYWKYFMATDKKAFPPPNDYIQKHAELRWGFQDGQYVVIAYGRFPMFCKADGHRWASAATPSKHTFPHKVITEDDVLHVRNLPSFDDVMGQRDSELLISYLTVPYMRLPLVMSFFATEDRIHTLKSKDLQEILNSVLFEPGRYLRAYLNHEPKFVPTKDPKLLATPYGLLLNELHRSPSGVIKSMLDLLRFALNLDTGTVHSTTVDIILFVVRTAARFDNAMSFLIDHTEGTHACISRALRDVQVTPRTLDVLKEGLVNLRKLLRVSVHKMLEAWCSEAMEACKNSLDNETVVDENTKIACNLHSHLVIIYRNVPYKDVTVKILSTFLSSFIFLTTRHTWNLLMSSIPETELFEAYQVQRRTLVKWLHAANSRDLSYVLESVVRVTAGTGIRVATGEDLIRAWGYIAGDRSVGRFTVSNNASLKDNWGAGYDSDDDVIETVPDHEHGVEINLQTSQLTLKTSHLKALDRKIAGHPDCQFIFGSSQMQCAVLESAQNRELVRLVGRHHDIAHWHTPDKRMALQINDRDYEPGFLPPTEEWIVPLFEPIRIAYFTQPVVVQFCLPEEVLGPDANVAYLVAIHPKAGGTWKEVFVFKDQGMVQIYNVMSHGRRFYRSLEYSTNAKFALREMQPPTEDRRGPWPRWGRHAAGHPLAQHPDPTSVVITRQSVLPNNLAGTDEMFVPSRLLYGIVPSALLDTHKFWQDDSDNLRGYPNDGSDHIIFVDLDEVNPVFSSSFPGVCARITRRSKGVDEALRTRKLAEISGETESKAKIPEADEKGDDGELLLLNLLYAPKGTPLFCLGQVLSRIENLSYVLAWTKNSKASNPSDAYWVDVVELPRLKMTFTAIEDESGEIKLFSVDHANFFVTNKRTELTTSLIRGIPHSLILSNPNDEPFILVPSIHPVRPFVGGCPFSTELVMNRANLKWLASLDTRYYLYPVHISLSFMFTPTLASALYLLLLRFMYRDYNDVFRLVNSIGTDVEFSEEEQIIFETLGSINSDAHPNAHACRSKISLVTVDSPVVCPWDLPRELAKYISKISHVTATCRLTDGESLLLLEICEEMYKKEAVIRQGYQSFDQDKLKQILKTMFDPVARLEVTQADRQAEKDFFEMLSTMIERALGITCTKEEILSILMRIIRGQVLSPFLRALLKNRQSFLQAKRNGSPTAACFVPPRASHSNWTLHRDDSAIAAQAKDWQALTLAHMAPRALTGHMVLDIAHKLWSPNENMFGSAFKMGFLFLYEIFTGTIKIKIGGQDDRHSYACLLMYLYRDALDRGVLQSILNICANNPDLCQRLPKFKDTRKMKLENFQGWRDDEQPDSPLDDLFQMLIPILLSESHVIKWAPDVSDFAALEPPDEEMPVPDIQLKERIAEQKEEEKVWDRSTLVPVLSNFACGERHVKSLEFGKDGLDVDEQGPIGKIISVSERDMHIFAEKPLRSIDLDEYVVFQTRAERQLENIPDEMPFDISEHPSAGSKVAKDMQKRLADDIKLFSDRENTGKVPKMKTLLDDDMRGFIENPHSEPLLAAINRIKDLLEKLIDLRERDSLYIKTAIPIITEVANRVNLPEPDGPDATEKYEFVLLKYSGQEATLWLDYLIGSLISSKARFDWVKLNPYIAQSAQNAVMDLIVSTLFHANRAGVANRAISDARDLLKLLKDCHNKDTTLEKEKLANLEDNLLTALLQRGESLASLLYAERWFIEEDESFRYDPRFLVFEFTWNILLRKQQVLLVREFMENITKDISVVRQMIMGAGKTTVVAPLLALMLADGKSLVMQVVPRALLEFSRSIMRSTFSSIMHKRIYTFHFDRATQIDHNVYKKLSNAVATSGIVISTPTAVKSLQLKYLEMLDVISDDSRPRHKDMEKDAAMLGEVLKIFHDGVLLMDEVDLILHPLKSELNFPIGAKHDLDFHPLRWKLPIHILDSIFFAERGRMSVGFKQSTRATNILERLRDVIIQGYKERAIQRIPHIVLLNPEFYHEQMKPIIAEWLFLWLEAQHVSGVTEEQMMSYIMYGAEPDSALSKAVTDNLSGKHKKMLNLSRDWLRSFLPHVLQKIDRVSFGILNATDYKNAMRLDPHMPRTRAKLGVPFVGKDVPSRSSEFAHPDIIIGLTILAYRYEGLRYTDFNDIIASLRATLMKEIGPFNERKSSQLHAAWVQENGGQIRGVPHYLSQEDQEEKKSEIEAEPENDEIEVVPLRLLKRSNDDQMLKLFNLIRKGPDVIHWYLMEFIFPAYMRHQTIKLSACGQEVGGDMLFGRRMGFSGTPSDLLPEELGRCGYEKGTDGLMMHTLCDPGVIDYSVLEHNWSVTSILDRIAKANPPFHALIDTGALVTGLTNHEVARYLLDHGLEGFEGVVFLDDLDRKVILVRATGRVLKLAQCGIELPKRFAFYDQVHTTGMDIKHVSNATAVVTMGKDMTFRDYSQGSFRMRGIGKGQTIHLFIIPEVEELIHREIRSSKMPPTGSTGLRKFLEKVSAWQVINSMRMERIQFNMLCLQNVANVWRKNGFRNLMQGCHRFKISEKVDEHLLKSLKMFREHIDFSLEAAVPIPRLFSETIEERVNQCRDFILTEEDEAVINKILKIVAGLFTGDDENTAFTAEMVQQQEEEKEKQQEQEQEQEIEIEKYVDLAYNRENEEQDHWEFSTLQLPAPGEQFYKANEFKLYKRAPIKFPEYMHVSNNYFDKRWSGDRRIKNVIMILELVPDRQKLRPMSQSMDIDMGQLPDANPLMSRTLTTNTEDALFGAFKLFDSNNSGDINIVEMKKVIRAAMDFTPTEKEIQEIMTEFGDEHGKIRYNQLKKVLFSDKFRVEEVGRYFVVVSLAEAETIRRIMHLRLECPIIDGANSAIALRCVAADNVLMDESHEFKEAHHYQSETAYQANRFLDCDMYYKDAQLNVLLRALQNSTTRERQTFFQLIIGCRRRMRRKWEETPLAKLFTLRTEFHLLKQRAQAVRTREAIQDKGLLLYDAFRMFDSDRNGLLAPAELYGALDWLGVKLTPADILEFIMTADSDGDGNINYKDFLDALRDPDAEAVDDEKDDVNELAMRKPLEMDRIAPKGQKELEELQARMNIERKIQEELETKAFEEDNKRVQKIKDDEQLEEDRQRGIAPNPSIDGGSIRYDFMTGRLPKLMSARGYIEYFDADDGKKYLQVAKQSFLLLQVPFGKNGGGENLNRYSVTMEVKLDQRPPAWQSLFQTVKAKRFKQDEGCIQIQHDGGVGALGTYGHNGDVKLKPNIWHLITLTVDCVKQEVITYVDGQILATIKGQDLSTDSKFSVDCSHGISIFGGKTSEMLGANIRFVLLDTRTLTPEEVTNLYGAHAAEGVWACDACSLRNEASAARCVVCQKERVHEAEGGAWGCPICTYHNRANPEKCEICETPRPK